MVIAAKILGLYVGAMEVVALAHQSFLGDNCSFPPQVSPAIREPSDGDAAPKTPYSPLGVRNNNHGSDLLHTACLAAMRTLPRSKEVRALGILLLPAESPFFL